MAFQIGNIVRLVSGNWLDSQGNSLVGGKYKVVADNPRAEVYIDKDAMTVEVSATRIWPEDFVLRLVEDTYKFKQGDKVVLVEDYGRFHTGSKGVVTSVRKTVVDGMSQMVYVDFGSRGIFSDLVGMFNTRLKLDVEATCILQMIETTSKRVGTGNTQAILLSLMEEVGELATEINIENGTKNREPSEDGIEGEAIDVLVVVCDLLTSLFGSLENPELRTKVAAKLAKWERNAQ